MDAEVTGGAARAVDAQRGITWWAEAWALFTKAAALWIVLGIVLLVILVVLNFVPFIGGLAAALLLPVFIGSWMVAVRKVDSGGALEIGDLFTGFQGEKLTPLLVIGGLVLAGVLVMVLVMMVLGAGAVFGGAQGSAGGMMAAMGAGMLAMLVALAFGVLIGMATWFAPALVVFRGVPPVDAMKASFAACLKNIVPFLLWGVIYVVAAFVASIPFGLGWIVLLPVSLLTIYVSYRDVFGG